MGHENTDEGRNRSAAASRSTSRRMRQRQCPQCGRKGALYGHQHLPSDVLSACRYCDYVVMREWE